MAPQRSLIFFKKKKLPLGHRGSSSDIDLPIGVPSYVIEVLTLVATRPKRKHSTSIDSSSEAG